MRKFSSTERFENAATSLNPESLNRKQWLASWNISHKRKVQIPASIGICLEMSASPAPQQVNYNE